LPILAMTAHALLEERQKAMEAGMNDHISKPIDPQAMFETLRRYYRKAREQDPRATYAVTPSKHDTALEIEGIDVKGGIRRVAGNWKLYLDLLRRYVEGQKDSAERVREALGNMDLALAERIAHTAKGVSGNIGAADVQAVAGELEESIEKGDTRSQTEAILKRFSRALEKTVARIGSALGATSEPKEKNSGKKVVASSVVKEILRKLTQYAEESDSEACEYLESTRDDLATVCSPKDLEKLTASLKSYKFSMAREALQQLSRDLFGSGYGGTGGSVG
jgi:two-component system sensor histidine kinase/response regulator